jgi:DNA-binding response OmpR family regulator
MLPKTLALVDDDQEFGDFLAQYLREQGVEVTVYPDSHLLLADPAAYSHGFYILDLMLPGISGLDLLKVLRLRTQAGILVVSGKLAPDVFESALTAGADMHLAKPVTFPQVLLAVKAVHRRAGAALPGQLPWRLDRQARRLLAPDGAHVDLSTADVNMLLCFVEAQGAVVSREQLQQRMAGGDDAPGSDGVYAAIYRLRRRIERATPATVPLQSKSRVGYLFKAPLKAL